LSSPVALDSTKSYWLFGELKDGEPFWVAGNVLGQSLYSGFTQNGSAASYEGPSYFSTLPATGSTVTDVVYFGDSTYTYGPVDLLFAVPEPASLSLLAVGAVAMLRRRVRA